MPKKEIDLEYKIEHLSILNEDGELDADLEPDISDDLLVKMHRTMLLTRRFDERMLKLQRQGKMGTFGPIKGQEASQIGAAAVLKEKDWLVPSFREMAAEVIAGSSSAFDPRAIPAVVYTYPQLAWCGLMEKDAEESGRKITVGRFPWSASGRAASMSARKGLTKMIMDEETGRILGVGIVGREAGEMISEGVLAVEMGAMAEDLALTIHPHPTLSETEEEAAGAFLGSSTHILSAKETSNG